MLNVSIYVSIYRHLVNTSLMSSTLEWRGQICINNIFSHIFRNETGR